MNSTIQQLALDSATSSIEKMTPIFIGASKVSRSEKPIFTDNTYNTIQLSLDNVNAIDETSIEPVISYWKELASFGTEYTSGTSLIAVSIATTTKFSNNCILNFLDESGELLYSSNVKSFIYNLTSLVIIELETPYSGNGYFNFVLILKTKETIPFTYNNITGQINLSFNDKSEIVSFPNVVVNESLISYDYINKSMYLKVYEKIENIDIINEGNIGIAKGLSLSKSAVVVSIPNESFVPSAIELIKTLNYGYYIVPIDLSYNSIQLLAGFVKNYDYSYFSLLVPAVPVLTKTLISGTLTK